MNENSLPPERFILAIPGYDIRSIEFLLVRGTTVMNFP